MVRKRSPANTLLLAAAATALSKSVALIGVVAKVELFVCYGILCDANFNSYFDSIR